MLHLATPVFFLLAQTGAPEAIVPSPETRAPALEVAAPPQKKPAAPAFEIVEPTTGFTLRARGNVQGNGRFFLEEAGGKNSVANAFYLRRVRPSVELALGPVSLRVMPDFGEGKVALVDAYADVELPAGFKLRVGKAKVPFGLERLQSQTDLPLIERSLSNGLAPNRDLGAQLGGVFFDKSLEVHAGVFNGVADEGSGDLDTDRNKDIAGRLVVRPFRLIEVEALREVLLGGAVTWGIHRGTPKAPQTPAYKTPTRRALLTPRTGEGTDLTAANTTIADGQQLRATAQAGIYVGPVGLLADWVRSEQRWSLAGAGERLRHEAFQATLNVVVTGEKATYTGPKLDTFLDLDAGTPGALELVARYDDLHLDDATGGFASRGWRSARSVWGGVNWYPTRNFKVSADFIHTWLLRPIGTSAVTDEDSVLVQTQFSF